jgi:hypothetical protein
MKMKNKLFLLLLILTSCYRDDAQPAQPTQLARGIAKYQLVDDYPELFDVHVTRFITGKDTSFVSYGLHNNFNHTTGGVDYNVMEARVLTKSKVKIFFPYP